MMVVEFNFLSETPNLTLAILYQRTEIGIRKAASGP